jgi:uncharacterized protein DUF2017
MLGRRVRRNRRGSFDLRLPVEERALLRSLPASVREALDGMRAGSGDFDPATARLFPGAYLDDPERDAEYRRLMHDELDAGRRAALETFEASVDAEELDHDQVQAWLRTLNDIRLLLGTRLDVTEEQASRQVDRDDPRAGPLAVYHYLSWLEEQLVEALDA